MRGPELRPSSEALAAASEAVLYLDFDGTLHNEAVHWDMGRKQPFLRAPARYTLFQHAALLDQMLAPYPGIAIVLSTSWVRFYGVRKAAKELPTGLRSRVILYLPRGEQVAADAERRRPARWLALDDDPIGWRDTALPHLLLTDPYEGISLPALQEELRRRLAQLAGAPLSPATSP
jgi:hypothetical protein